MRTKGKIKILTLGVMLLVLGICYLVIMSKNTEISKTYAAANNCEFEAYGHTSYVKNVSYGQSTSGSYLGTPNLFTIMMYTEDYYGVGGSLNDGALLNWRRGGFYLESNGPVSIRNVKITRDGNYFASGFYSVNFNDGNYSMKVVLESRESASVFWTYTFTFNFIIDNTAPRTSLTANGMNIGSSNYTNGAISFSASDTRFKYIHYKRPYSNYATYSGANYSVPAREENNGWWYFYADDRANNRSSEVSVYLDTIKPVGKMSSKGATVASGGYTNETFSYTATDNSGSVTHSIKKPQSETWESYTAGTSVSEISGLYRFRSTDKAGNVSEEYTVFYDNIIPTVKLYAGSSLVSTGAVTNASHISFTALDNASGVAEVYVKQPSSNAFSTYINGSQLTNEGQYTFYAVDKSYNSTQHYTITIDRTAPAVTVYAGSQTAETNSYVNAEFVRFSASDDSSKVAVCYAKKPRSNSFVSVTNGTPFSEEGKYIFYAIDNAGNSSLEFALTLDRTKPSALLYAGDNEVENCSYTNASYISFVTGDTNLKASFVKLPGATNFINYSSGSMYFDKGKYTFYSVDKANNRTEDCCLIIDREPKPLTLENVVGGTTDKNVVILWMDGDPKDFAPVKRVTINGVSYNKGDIIYTINTGNYNVVCEDIAGNVWQTEFSATTKNIKTETLQQQYFEGADNDGNIFAFESIKNALNFLTAEEKKFVRIGTWNSSVWDTGIMMDEVDSVSAVNGNYYIYKSEKDAKSEVAYFTENRLNEVINSYAKARIKSYFYFEKYPAKNYEGNDLYAYKNGFAVLGGSVEFYDGISVSINGTPLQGQFYDEMGQHSIVITDLYGNSCHYTATIVRSSPTINYSIEEGKTNAVTFDREYKLSSKVTLTITDELDEMAMYYVTDNGGKSLGYFYRDQALVVEKSGRYIVRAVNHFGQSQEFVLYISLENPSVNLSANIETKRLEVNIFASSDSYTKLQSLAIYKSVDNGETWEILDFDDYGKTISLDDLSYNFRTSGLYKVSITDEFRTGIDLL